MHDLTACRSGQCFSGMADGRPPDADLRPSTHFVQRSRAR